VDGRTDFTRAHPSGKLAIMNCPSFKNLIAYMDGEMVGTTSEAFAAHMATGCAKCAIDSAWYESIKAIAASDDTTDAPQWVLKRAVKLFETQITSGKIAASAGRFIASLVFDSLARPAPAGARTVATTDRQLLYQANHYSIDLQFAALDERRTELSGQILREGEFKFESVSGLKLNLLREGRTVLSTITNKFGEFSIAALEQGEYDLKIETPEMSITVVGLPVG
jgi:hypothetical protein